jgi:hypothetical protein
VRALARLTPVEESVQRSVGCLVEIDEPVDLDGEGSVFPAADCGVASQSPLRSAVSVISIAPRPFESLLAFALRAQDLFEPCGSFFR